MDFVITLQLSLLSTLGFGLAPPPNDQQGRDERGVAIAELLNHYDAQIKSIETLQKVEIQVYIPATAEHEEPSWRAPERYREGRFGEDSGGNWYFRGSMGGRADFNSEMTQAPGCYASTPGYSVGWQPGADVFIIQEPLELPRYYAGPFMALGRWLDTTGSKRIGELLLASKTLQIQDVEQESGMVMLRGEAEIDGVPNVLLVTVDSRHGFGPVAIRRFDATYNSLIEEIINTEFTLVDDIWIPTAGTRVLFSRSRLSAKEMQRFNGERQQNAREMNLESDHPDVIRAVASSMFGERGWPVTPLGPVMTSFKVTETCTLNQPLSTEMMTAFASPEATIFNTVNGLDTEVSPMEDVLRGCDLIKVVVDTPEAKRNEQENDSRGKDDEP
ncbi:MAG: hypothetical protein ACR2GY_10240 [Phycisphaerales bacterium]